MIEKNCDPNIVWVEMTNIIEDRPDLLPGQQYRYRLKESTNSAAGLLTQLHEGNAVETQLDHQISDLQE